MNPVNLKLNTYVPAEQAQFAAPVSFDRREFLARSVSAVLRISSSIDLGAESSLLSRELLSSPGGAQEFLPYDDLTPLEKAARRLMLVVSSAKQGSHDFSLRKKSSHSLLMRVVPSPWSKKLMAQSSSRSK